MRSPIFYKPNIGKRILWVILIIAVVLAVVFLANILAAKYLPDRENDAPMNDQPHSTPISFELDPGVNYENASGNSKLYFYSAENIKITDKSGTLLKDLTLRLAQPKISIRGEYALFYDLGGRRLITFLGEKQVSELSLESNIVLASVSSGGYLLVVTEGDLHKCAVSVYNPNGEEIFKWNSGGLSVVAADIADNNKEIAISTMNTDSAVIKSNIIMFNLSKDKPFTNDVYENDIFSRVHYSGSHVYCIGTTGAKIYNLYGKCVGSATYDNRELTHVAIADDLMVLGFTGTSKEGGVAEIKSYTHKGEESGSFVIDQDILFLDIKEGTIAVSNAHGISILNGRCRERFRVKPAIDLRDFSFIGNDRHGIGITATGAEIIKLGA
ncbi:MAG: hypothetical protein E7418_00325 [Ruminococcaceae bacterium]|nr:hypothetical protein [Oscillospiraceae bacterium]